MLSLTNISSHSFGFECTKRSNLHVLDEENVLFAAGNTVQILNMKTQQQTHIRTTSGGGIGAVAVSTWNILLLYNY